MDGGTEAVNSGLLCVATAFNRMTSTCDKTLIEQYNLTSKRWRELAVLATKPNVHQTKDDRRCPECRGIGCRVCSFTGGAVNLSTACRVDNCDTCAFDKLCVSLNIRLQNMPATGPWQEGFVQPAIPEGMSREGRFLPGQVVRWDFTSTSSTRNIFYVVAALDQHCYAVVYGRQEREEGRSRTRGWLPPTWTRRFGIGSLVQIHQTGVNGAGVELAVSNYSNASAQALQRVEVQPGWTLPTLTLKDYLEVRGAIVSRF